MKQTFVVLGCGNSAGVPAIGNLWGNCDPNEPRNRRTRPAVAVQSGTTTLIVDTGPDIRDQLNRENIQTIDAVLYTHAHGDHVHGIDDLRVVRNKTKKLIPIYGNRETIEELEDRFSYLFVERHGGIYPKVLEPHVIERERYGEKLAIGDIEFTAFEQDHGTGKSLGFRFGDIGYSTDMIDLDQAAVEALSGVKTWVVDAAGYKMPKNYVHCTLNEVYALNEVVQAEKVYLTHLPPSMDYRALCKELPAGYEPAYDGLRLDIAP